MKKIITILFGFAFIILQSSCLTSKKSKMEAEMKAEQMEQMENNENNQNMENMENMEYNEGGGSMHHRRRRMMGGRHLL